MAKIDYEKLAAEIIGKVGGTENIHTVSHCATRLRFVLKDRSLANEKELRQLAGCSGICLWLRTVSGNSWRKPVPGI